MQAPPASPETLDFDTALAQLNAIVLKLQDQTISLEESIQAFHEAMKLKDICARKLEEAESTIQTLLNHSADGTDKWDIQTLQTSPSQNTTAR